MIEPGRTTGQLNSIGEVRADQYAFLEFRQSYIRVGRLTVIPSDIHALSLVEAISQHSYRQILCCLSCLTRCRTQIEALFA